MGKGKRLKAQKAQEQQGKVKTPYGMLTQEQIDLHNFGVDWLAELDDDMDGEATYEEMREEAEARLGVLVKHGFLMQEVLDDFVENGAHPLYHSEVQGNLGILYWTDQLELTMNDGTPIQEMVDILEKERGCVVYHSIHFQAVSNYGERFDVLYMLAVSKYKSDWHMDRRDLLNAMPYAWVPVIGFKDSYDYSPVGIKPAMGGIGPVLNRMPEPLFKQAA